MLFTDRFKAAATAAVFAAVTLPGAAWSDQRVRCESNHNHYTRCDIEIHGRVRVLRQRSLTKCRLGDNWGYDRAGIWVDNGCRADFLVEERRHDGRSRDHGFEGGDYRGRGFDGDYRDSWRSSGVPRWMRGDWVGYDRARRTEIELSIARDGKVRAYIRGDRVFGYASNERMRIGNVEFHIERTRNGFRAIERGDRSNRIRYRRR
jgi:hypothetical protein